MFRKESFGKKKMKKLFLLPLLVLTVSCSVNKLTVKAASKTLDCGLKAVFEEKDLDYAKQALPANLKLMEILLENDKDETLLVNASMGFCGYAWAFLEESSPAQAESFYKKGIFYSNILLEKKRFFKKGKLEAKAVNEKNAPALFWNTFCKSALINLNPSDSENSVLLAETQEQAELLASKSPSYFYNAVYAILGSIYASKPKIFGGDTQKAKVFFDKASQGEGENFYLSQYMYAKTYAIAVQDEELFLNTLEKILSSKKEDSKAAFFNEVAKKKAAELKEKKDEYF